MDINELKNAGFPEFVRALPEADLPFEGIRGWLLNSDRGQLLFLEAETEADVTEHSHGNQWGIVVAGEMELTIGGETATYRQGDSYYIPAGVMHRATLHTGFKVLDYFEDSDRYTAK